MPKWPRNSVLLLAGALGAAAATTGNPTGNRTTPPTLNTVAPLGVARGTTVEMMVEGLGRLGGTNASRPAPIGSVAKVMTAYLVLKEYPLAGAEPGPTLTVRAADVEDYQAFPSYWPDAMSRKWNLWGYIDARDAASAFRHALAADTAGAMAAIIANDDTVLDRPSADLLKEVFPDVEVRRALDVHQTLLANDRAKQLFGWTPTHSWRQELSR